MTTIKETRHTLGLTQKQMADLLGMSQSGVGRIESGYECRSETRQLKHHLAALEVISDSGLMGVLAAKVEGI